MARDVASVAPYVCLLGALVFWGYCLVDFAQSDERRVRTFPKPVWLVLLVFGNVLGGLLWLIAGRPEGHRRR